MNTQRKYSFTISLIIISLSLVLWIFLNSAGFERRGVNIQLKGIGSFFGAVGYFLLAFSLFLSSRWKRLENLFGGLDYVYNLHRLVGIWGFCFIAIHPLILSMKFIPQRMDKFFSFSFPFHDRLSVNLGSYAFWLMTVILIITIFKLFPYDKWKITHKFLSLSFILASFHFLLSSQLFGNSLRSKGILLAPMIVGLISIFYKQVIYSFYSHFPTYEVIRTEKLNHNLIEIHLKPQDQKISFIPGQYAFFSFQTKPLSSESHPFTLCESSKSDSFSILIKARGDFTKRLYQHVKEGCLAKVEGPYGKFDYKKGKTHQVWIAGGIGIAPFLTWARRLAFSKETKYTIDLFYAVHSEKDKVFGEEFMQINAHLSSFRFFPFCSEEHEKMTAATIQKQVPDLLKRSILMCGPKRMTKDLRKQFLEKGVHKDSIYFEDFEFF